MEGHSVRLPEITGRSRQIRYRVFRLPVKGNWIHNVTLLGCHLRPRAAHGVGSVVGVGTDPQASECTRTWGCACGNRNASCPYHAAWVQHKYIHLQVAPLKVITDTLLKADASMVRAHQSRSRRSSERLHPMRRKPAIRRRTTLPSGQCVRGHQVCGRANAGKARASQPGRSGSPGVALVHQRLGAEDRKLATHACTDARAVVNNNWLGAVHRNVCAWALEPPGM